LTATIRSPSRTVRVLSPMVFKHVVSNIMATKTSPVDRSLDNTMTSSMEKGEAVAGGDLELERQCVGSTTSV